MSPSEKKASRSTHLGVALPAALSAALLLGVVAFGATGPANIAFEAPTERPKAAVPADPNPVSVVPDEPKPTPRPGEQASTEPVEQPVEDPALFPRKPATEKDPEPTPKPTPAETVKPKPAETAKPKPAPSAPGTLTLEGWAKETKAKLAWKPYGGDGFEYYKVVRSADAAVTWPASGDDVVVGVISDAATTWWADAPPCGTAWTYRVFAVRHGQSGYDTLAASNTVAVTTACGSEPTPKPEGCGMGFEVRVKAGVGIKLAWEPCHDEAFAAYKVVRSLTNPDPRYPLNDGTELIAVIGDRSSTFLLDEAVAPGETWTYRVVAVGEDDGALTVIGQSAARAATAE